jgi:hypothetical protein
VICCRGRHPRREGRDHECHENDGRRALPTCSPLCVSPSTPRPRARGARKPGPIMQRCLTSCTPLASSHSRIPSISPAGFPTDCRSPAGPPPLSPWHAWGPPRRLHSHSRPDLEPKAGHTLPATRSPARDIETEVRLFLDELGLRRSRRRSCASGRAGMARCGRPRLPASAKRSRARGEGRGARRSTAWRVCSTTFPPRPRHFATRPGSEANRGAVRECGAPRRSRAIRLRATHALPRCRKRPSVVWCHPSRRGRRHRRLRGSSSW